MKFSRLSLFLTQKKTLIFFFCLSTLMVSGIAIILATTRLGAGLSDDSYAYIKPVRDFVAGKSMSLDPAFPPFVNYVLVIPGILGIDPLVSLRYLNALLFGLSIFLSGMVLRNTTSIFYSLLGAFILLISRVLIEAYSWALSEPIYLFLCLLAFYLLDECIKTNKLKWLILSSFMVALALLTRYAGITVFLACFIVLIISTIGDKEYRMRKVAIFVAISLLPVAIYILVNYATTGNSVGTRVVDLRYMLELSRINSALYNMITWFLPGRFVKGKEIYFVLILFVSLVVVSGYYWFTNKEKFASTMKTHLLVPINFMLFAWAVTNFVMLYLGQGFLFGKGEAFNNRYLAPVYLAVILLIVSILVMFWELTGKISHYFIASIFVVLIFIFTVKAKDTIFQLYENGAGYASARWHISETIAYLNKHPDVPIIGTGGVGIYFWTGRLPVNIKSPAETREWLRSTGGYLVIIDSMSPDFYGIDKNELTSGLKLVYQFSEGSIYQYP